MDTLFFIFCTVLNNSFFTVLILVLAVGLAAV